MRDTVYIHFLLKFCFIYTKNKMNVCEEVDLLNKNINRLINLENAIISLTNLIEIQSEKLEHIEDRIENWVIINQKTLDDNKDEKLKEESLRNYDRITSLITTLFSPFAIPLSMWMSVKILF